jgi:hypothetical protein
LSHDQKEQEWGVIDASDNDVDNLRGTMCLACTSHFLAIILHFSARFIKRQSPSGTAAPGLADASKLTDS